MPRNPYDPVEMGLAAGSSADPLNLNLSEKSARDLKDAAKSVETAGKMGTFSSIYGLVMALIGVGSSPYIKLLTDFFETLGKFYNAEVAETVGRIREYMYSDSSIAAMKAMAKYAANGSEEVGYLITALEKLYGAIEDANTMTEDFGTKWGEFIEKMQDFPPIGENLGGQFVNAVERGFMSALKAIDWKGAILDIIEDEFDL